MFWCVFRTGPNGAHAGSKGEYGWPRIWKDLISRGVRVGKDRIQKLMKLHGIKARGKRRDVVTTDSKHNLPIAPNLLDRNFQPERPNAVWTSDITYIATDEGWLYLAAAMDLYARQAFPREFVEDRQDSEFAPVTGFTADEVIAPDVFAVLRLQQE